MERAGKLRKSLPGLRHTARHFWPHIRRSRVLIGGSFLALIVQVGLRLLEPWPLKFVFDRVMVTSPSGGLSLVPFVDALEPLTLLTVAALAIVVIIGLRALATYAATVGFTLVGNRVLTAVRNDLFRHLQRLSLSFHSQHRTGDLTIRVIHDINMLKDVVINAFLPLLGRLLVLFGMLGVMFWLHWQLTLLALAVAPFFWLATLRLGRRIRKAARRQRRQEGKMAATTAESMTAIETVQALSLEENFAQGFQRHNEQSLKEGVKARRLQASLVGTVDVLIAIATALVVWYGARLVLNNVLTPGDLLVFLTYLRRSFRPQRELARYTGRIAQASAAGERIVDVLESTPAVSDLPGAVPAPPFAGQITYEDVSFAYEPGRYRLERVQFDVAPGQHVALVGPSGGGKSTLVSLLLRLYDPVQGRVMIDGHDIREYTLASLRNQISVVLQEGQLFSTSVRDNISQGRADITLEEIMSAARLANADEFIQNLPFGYDTKLTERGKTLSVGQRQRLNIARAAIHKAPILVMDEPTSGLDEENRQIVIQALKRLWHGRVALLTTHDLRLAANADLILFLDDGRILESGTFDELMRLNGRYAAMYRLQETVVKRNTREEDTHAVTG